MTQFVNVLFLCVPVHADTTQNYTISNEKIHEMLLRCLYFMEMFCIPDFITTSFTVCAVNSYFEKVCQKKDVTISKSKLSNISIFRSQINR